MTGCPSVIIATQRVGALATVPILLLEFGVDPTAVLAQAGLDRHALDNPEATIPYAAMGRVAELAAAATRCSHFGLLIGQQIDASALGIVGKLMKTAPTLGNALMDLVTHQQRHARGSTIYLFRRKDRALFGYTVYHPGASGLIQIYDGAAAAAFSIVRGLLDCAELTGLQVSVSRARPTDDAPYRALFAVPVRFNAGHTGVSFPIAWLDRPIASADPSARSFLETQVAAFQAVGPNDVVTQVKRGISIGLLTGEVSSKQIATTLDYSERTLQRRLAEQATSFQDLLDNARFALAKHFLSGTKLTVRDIASIVGLAETAVFTRAFSLWSGMPPSRWRSRQHAIPME